MEFLSKRSPWQRFFSGLSARQRSANPVTPLEHTEDIHAFIEHYLWIRDKDDRLVRFTLNYIQQYLDEEMAKAVERGRKPWYLILKYRQGGVTTLEQGKSFQRVITRPHQHCITIADTEKKTAGIWRMVNRFYDNLDPMSRPKRSPSRTNIEIPEHDSIFEFYTAGSQSPGRGFTLSRVHLSEVAQYKINDRDMGNLMSGIKEGAARGEIVAETTAQGIGGWFHHEWKEAMRGNSEFTPIFLPWHLDPLNRLPVDHSIPMMLNEEESHVREVYGLDDEQIMFRRQKQREQGKFFMQEFPENHITAFLLSGSSYFAPAVIQQLMARVRRPVEQGDELVVWHPPEDKKRYWIGGDTAEGNIDSNFSSAGVIDMEGRQCARFQGRTRTADFARRLVALGTRYNNAFIGVESNNHGHAVITSLRDVLRYPYLFIHYQFDSMSSRTGKEGWQTTPKTRPIMLADLEEALRTFSMEVNDDEFLSECGTFVDDGTGKYKARQGCHDDLVIAWAIAWQLRKSGAGEFKAYVI